jgi:hypothetical protein
LRFDATETTLGTMDVLGKLISLVILACLVFPIVVGIIALIKWRGGWRIAGAAPLAVMFLFCAWLVPGRMRAPTANNLWGFAFIPLGLVLYAYSAIVLLLHRRRGTSRT